MHFSPFQCDFPSDGNSQLHRRERKNLQFEAVRASSDAPVDRGEGEWLKRCELLAPQPPTPNANALAAIARLHKALFMHSE